MFTSQPPLGLLLDVDGPIANPETRRVDQQSIAKNLVKLARAGVPIAFNTGRSATFIAQVVVPALSAAGLRDTDRTPYLVGEKGGVWAKIHPETIGHLEIDADAALPKDFFDEMREVIASAFSDTMEFDETKHVMVSAEKFTHTPYDDYYADQAEFDEVARKALQARGFAVVRRDETWPASDPDKATNPVRIDPTVISTDIEMATLNKAAGAARAHDLFAADGPLPTKWLTAGDSAGDYAMADWLHEHGFEVTHLDVRPAKDGATAKPYPVRTIPGQINDIAMATVLEELVEELKNEAH